MATFNKYYSKQGLWTLFLISALPLHIWTLFLSLRDFDWVTARTNSWDAVGVISYGLVFAFIESIVVFAVVALLGFLVSTKWDEKKRVALMGILILVLSIWSIFNHTYFLQEMEPSEQIIKLFLGIGRPLVALYLTGFFFVVLSVTAPTYFILHSNKVVNAIHEGFDRLGLLMSLYLFLDVAALVIILIRNF